MTAADFVVPTSFGARESRVLMLLLVVCFFLEDRTVLVDLSLDGV